jgi:hypothetical protein
VLAEAVGDGRYSRYSRYSPPPIFASGRGRVDWTVPM